LVIEHATILILIASLLGLFMAWGVGANDVANAMGTSVGSKALTIRSAIIIAIIFEVAGVLFASGEVTHTIGGKIVDPHLFEGQPEIFICGMLASLMAAGLWLLMATLKGWPVSTTHSIIGAVIGFGMVAADINAVKWLAVRDIALSWIISPLLAGSISYILFGSVQKLIFHAPAPLQRAKKYIPYYIFFVAFTISSLTLLKGLHHLGLNLGVWQKLGISFFISSCAFLVGTFLLAHILSGWKGSQHKDRALVEKLFAVLMIFTACAMAFAHGSNDVANAIGPLTALVQVAHAGKVLEHYPIPFWIIALGAIGIVLGLSTFGYRVMATLGKNITQLTPSRGFVAELATATTVVLASILGLPVSTTQILVGAILGVGIAGGLGALNLAVIRNIFMSWIITLPIGAGLSILFFYGFKFILI